MNVLPVAVLRAVSRVRATDITKLYGATPALRGVSADFEAGSITLLSGLNGAGKSTLLSILGTRQRPTRGSVVYSGPDGRPLERVEVRARLGWVSHESHAYADLSGWENLTLVAELQGASLEDVARVADRVGLGRFRDRPVSTLSRGQKQRVALGRALVHEPGLLLLDEPWTGLDVNAGAELERIVLEERARGALVLIVSHEPGLAERLGAREICLVGGKLQSSSSR